MHSPFEHGFGQTPAELDLPRLLLEGQIPAWLHGTLLRNGPGTFRVGEQRYRHWFDGLAMLHKFAIANGQVSYANKYLRGRAFQAAQDTGRISYSEFATDPCRSFFGRVMSVFSPQITDSAKVSIAQIADRFLALAETPIQVEFDPETLATVGVFNYEEGEVGQMTTVHPHIDSAQGIVYNVVTRYHRVSHYRLYAMHGKGTPIRIGQLPVKQPAYMHSFGMSQNYLILSEFPLVVNPLNLLLWLRPYIENFRWRPERGTPFWVVDRFTGEVVGHFESEAFFAFHHVNAFEQGDDLFVDIVGYPDADILNAYYLDRLADTQHEIPFGQFRRYQIPLRGGRATYEIRSNACMELPRFDYERYNMRGDYHYVYAVSIDPEQRQGFYNRLVKLNIATGESTTWQATDCFPGEPVFVGAPDRNREDEGVVLSVVLDAAAGTSFLLILDAERFEEVGRATLPQAVLFGYHGDYFGVG